MDEVKFKPGDVVNLVTLGYSKQYPYFKWLAKITNVGYDEMELVVNQGTMTELMYANPRTGYLTSGGVFGWVERLEK